MEQEAESDQKKSCFLIKQLIGTANVLNKKRRKYLPLQILFSQLLSKMRQKKLTNQAICIKASNRRTQYDKYKEKLKNPPIRRNILLYYNSI
jgi:hypothetical protein